MPDSIIKKNKLRQVFYGLPDNDFDIIYKSIKKYLQNNVNVHSYKLPNLYYDINYDVLEEHYARVIEGLFNIGKISHNSIETYIDEIEEIVDAEYDEVVSANPRLKDVLPENILSITSKKISNEFLCDYLSVNVFLEFSFFPINLFKNLFKKFLFIEGVRAKQEIVYTKENSPGFFDLLDLAYKEGFQNFNINDELNKWASLFKIINHDKNKELEKLFEIVQIGGYGYRVKIHNNNKAGLSGLGYGITQLFPILLRIAISRSKIIVIEEPESNLHPALQSKLADLFVQEINNEPLLSLPNNFIIETHSEYLIRKLQYLTAKGVVDKEKIQLYYFIHPENITNDTNQITLININDDGSLTNEFGTGFFDEADNIALELFLLKSSQKN